MDDTSPAPAERPLVPLLHDLVSCVRAPELVLSAADGQLRSEGVQGWFAADRRLLAGLLVTIGGDEPVGIGSNALGAEGASFVGVVQRLGDVSPDPTVVVDRVRRLDADGLTEQVTVTSAAQTPVGSELTVQVATDLAPVGAVRAGRAAVAVPAEPEAAGGLEFRGDGVVVTVEADPPGTVDPPAGRMSWPLDLTHGESLTVRLRCRVRTDAARSAGTFDPRTRPRLPRPDVTCPDPRLARVVAQGLDDLDGLLLADPDTDPETLRASGADHFAAAGSPWFLTLFGRDSLWVARMLLPVGTDLAMSTLRVLARRQGTAERPDTEEQPGKILHEIRGDDTAGDHMLPPLYYGSIDATPLFVVLLAEAWRWGADPAQVRELVPAARRCLQWAERAAGDDGFLRYVDTTGAGLANQGWKDSHDSIQWADGTLAEAPIALCEAQAYAYQAAALGADLLAAFGADDADHWRAWAAALAQRFRAAFWVRDEQGPYPAVALDGQGRAVDSVTSNLGHLLGTGLLDEEESALVAGRLEAPALAGGFGLRTLTADSPRFSRVSYHGGSVWPHDTAIAVAGLARSGHGDTAARLLDGLVQAAPAFDYRLPELFGGDSRADTSAPVAYPAACRPQAWAAAAPLSALCAVLGIEPDVPAGVVRVRGAATLPFGPVSLRGLDVGGARLDVEVAADGAVTARCTDPSLRLEIG